MGAVTEISERYRRIADGFTARIDGRPAIVGHTWDLARATGQDERLDPEGVSTALTFLVPIDEAIRRPGGFAAKIDPPAGADEQTRLLNFCGRSAGAA